MNSQIYLFCKRGELNMIDIEDRFTSFYFSPTLFNLKLHQGSVLLYFFWYAFSFGKYRVFYIVDIDTSDIVHYSNILPKIFKYDFMKRGDMYIVNCYTDPLFRGNQLYPFALSIIGKKYANNSVWVGSRSDNNASLSGIKKAGYILISKVYKSMFLGIYRLSNDE